MKSVGIPAFKITLCCLFRVSKVVKFIETETRIVVSMVWRPRAIGSFCLMGSEFQVIKMERVLEMDGGAGGTQV